MLRRVVLTALCSAVSLFAQQTKAPPKQLAPVTGLKVLSVTIDLQTHEVSVQLKNVSSKTVVAYHLETKGLDAQGNQVGAFQRQFDYAQPEPNPEAKNFILPGQIATVEYTKPAIPPPDPLYPDKTPPPDFSMDAVASVQIVVLSIVYQDRTYEGGDDLFGTRSRKAAAAHQVLNHFPGYPATREKNRAFMDTLRLLGFNAPEEALSKEHWETIRVEMERAAAWWDSQKRPLGVTAQ